MGSWLTIACLLILAFFAGLILRFLYNRISGGAGLGRLRGWLVPVVVIWALLSAWWYVCKIKQECGGETEVSAPAPVAEVTPPKAPAPAPTPEVKIATPKWQLSFDWGSDVPIIGPGFDAFRDKWLKGLKPGHLLKVVGLYHPGEPNNSGFENLGLARAEKIKGALSRYLDGSRIEAVSALISGSPQQDQPFEAYRFEDQAPPPPPVKQVDHKRNIYFASSSDLIIWDGDLKAYLDEVAEWVVANDEGIFLTGYTDSTGNQDFNQKLSERRAQSVHRALLDRGVKSSRITTNFLGADHPASSNKTKTGRHNNRRVELEIR